MTEQRKLAAVMFTDIVGYTAMMSKDEKKVFALLQRNRDLQQSLAKKHNGEFLKEMGDGTLLCFQSALDAVRCAMEIQQSVEDDPELNLRIGIHLGDVVFKEGDAFGDGVNVASRIEKLASEGGICISSQIYQMIRNKSAIEAVSIGKKKFKNVDYPIQIYSLVTKSIQSSRIRKPRKKKRSTFKKVLIGSGIILLPIIVFLAWYIQPFLKIPESITQEHDKAIAVLYFDNMSSEEDAYFTDGLTEELISRLTRIKNLKVASRTDVKIYKKEPASIAKIGEDLNVDYVVEGSVRKAGKMIRITAQLISTKDSYHSWSEMYDREITDIFKVQDEVALNIAQRLDMEITKQDQTALVEKPTENLQAYELVLKAKSMLSSLSGITPDYEFEEIYSMLEKAIELDPRYSEARGALAGSYAVHLGMKESLLDMQTKRNLINKALVAAQQTLPLDPMNEIALTVIPVLLSMKSSSQFGGQSRFDPFQYRKVKVKINRLVKLYPESAIANLGIGTYYWRISKLPRIFTFGDKSQKAIIHFHRAIDESERILKTTPNDPIALYAVSISNFYIGDIYINQGKYQEAFNYFRAQNEILKRTGNRMEIGKTYDLAQLSYAIGRHDNALQYYQRLLEIIDAAGDSVMIAFGDSTGYIRRQAHFWLGRIYVNIGRYSEAFNHYNELLDIYQSTDIQGSLLHLLGETQFYMGNYTEASEYFSSANKIWNGLDEKKQRMWTNSWQARTKIRLNKPESAERIVTEIMGEMQINDPYPGDIVIINWNLYQVYDAIAQPAKGIECLELAYKEINKIADTFTSLEARESFLTDIPENREIIAAWGKYNQSH